VQRYFGERSRTWVDFQEGGPQRVYQVVREKPFFYFGSWSTLALVNMGLAEQKGRSRFAWMLWSALFGPVATAYIVLMPGVHHYHAPK